MLSVRTTYAPDSDMTFILQEQYNDSGALLSIEVTGFYFGKPEDLVTAKYLNSPKAEMSPNDFKELNNMSMRFVTIGNRTISYICTHGEINHFGINKIKNSLSLGFRYGSFKTKRYEICWQES